ncbi:MAG: STAS domain-containing protein, partial [Treponema sp.]|nr:STAS domain-containing protein [Treponema sp.]
MEWTRLDKTPEGYELIKLIGDCDLYGAPGFALEILRRIENGSRRLKLDLSEVRYLDSTGVGAIIRI